MNLINRVKNIILTPVKEWDVIATETPDTGKIVTGYVLPLAGAAALAAFIGYGFVGFNVLGFKISGGSWGLYQALYVLVMAVCSVFIGAFVIDALAPSFSSEKNMNRSVQLVAYSYTPAWIGGLLSIFPPLAFIGTLAGIYGLYLLYAGLPKLKKTPDDKQLSYFIVSLIVLIVIYFIIGFIMNRVVMSAMGLSYSVGDIKVSF